MNRPETGSAPNRAAGAIGPLPLMPRRGDEAEGSMTGLIDIQDGPVGSAPLWHPPRNRSAGPRPLVVEIFGPAAAGKTTLAHALHRALEAAGCRSKLVASARPAERVGHGSGPEHAVRRTLIGPLSRAAKVFGAIAELRSQDVVGAQLLALLPPRTPLWRLRQRRYLARLDRALAADRSSAGVLILDQGYLSALCALAAMSGRAQAADTAGILVRGLDLMPAADLVVWVETPRAALEERLSDRLARQTPLERLFELDLPTTMEQARLADVVCGLLRARGCPVLQVSGRSQAQLDDAVLRASGAVCVLLAENAA